MFYALVLENSPVCGYVCVFRHITANPPNIYIYIYICTFGGFFATVCVVVAPDLVFTSASRGCVTQPAQRVITV